MSERSVRRRYRYAPRAVTNAVGGGAIASRGGRLGWALPPKGRSSAAAAALQRLGRAKIGRLLGWDGPDTGVDARVASLRERLPADLRAAPTGPDFTDVPMTSVYLLENEWAAEMANRTVHSVMHIGWVADEDGAYRAQMAVLTKPNGWFGAAYMAAIKPFRYLLVYPALMRWIERAWYADVPSAAWAGAAA